MRFEKPALFVRGTHSKYVPDEVIPLIGQFFPRFSLVDIEAGHWLIAEKPDEFLQGKALRQDKMYGGYWEPELTSLRHSRNRILDAERINRAR